MDQAPPNPQQAAPFVEYGQYSHKMLVGTKTIVNFINSNLLETPIHYITFIRTYRPRLRRAGVLRQDRISRRDVAIPFMLAKYWEENVLGNPRDRPPSEAARELAATGPLIASAAPEADPYPIDKVN